jgi:hypothetical protein
MSQLVIGGIYRHYKGGMYQVKHIAFSAHHEMVVYHELYKCDKLLVRPATEFSEKTMGQPRFRLLLAPPTMTYPFWW